MLKLDAKWKDDCQGKKDYDGEILSVSTRYWPRGGGFFVGAPGKGIEGNEARPEIKPSAKSSIMLRHSDEDSITLVEAEFEGETQEEVQRQVEIWAQARFDEVVDLLARHFDVKI